MGQEQSSPQNINETEIDKIDKTLKNTIEEEKVIEKNVQFGLNDDVSDLEEFNENGKKGYKLTVKTMEELSLQNKSYYSIESTNYIYLIKYSTYDYKM